MLDAYLRIAAILLVALLFGGMLLFSVGFAAFLFKNLPPAEARVLIRKVFPPFYLFVIFSAGLATALFWGVDSFNAALMAFVVLSTLAGRQLLMPAINRATDLGLRKRFVWLHGFSVVLSLGHIVIAAVVLVRAIN
jgi:hypothetical protein